MEQLTLAEASEEYKAFVDKFKPKLTTDDCYTPPNIYETVKEWVFEREKEIIKKLGAGEQTS